MSLQAEAIAPRRATWPLLWSVRRELWESPSVTVVPLATAALVLVAAIIRALLGSASRIEPYQMAALALVVTSFAVAVFHAADALQGERRERSLHFWKSLPVSDTTTVLAKLAIPLVVLPLLELAITVALQLAMLVVDAGHASGIVSELVALWGRMAFGVTALSLWHAPIFAWLLLVSAWARRLPLLWALFPPLAVALVERIALGTTHVAEGLRHRLVGVCTAFVDDPRPIDFLTRADLWLGLAAAALLVAGAIWFRRTRELT